MAALALAVVWLLTLDAQPWVLTVKWGHLLRFDPDEIDAWLDSARVPPAQEGVSS